MPDFKHLAEGGKLADPERFIPIEVIHEPAIGKQYKVTGPGLDPNSQPSGDSTHRTLEEAREWVLTLQLQLSFAM